MTNSSVFLRASSFSETVRFSSKTLVSVNKVTILMLMYLKKYIF